MFISDKFAFTKGFFVFFYEPNSMQSLSKTHQPGNNHQ